jgi:hypothetical protein
MKKSLFIFWVISLFFASCGNNGEVENLKKENAALVEQVNALKSGNNAKAPKYILKLHLQQSHLSLSIKKHIKDAMNAIDFEIPVDKEFFDSVSKGTSIVDKFRFGSLVLAGSFGDWEMIVKDKVVR